MDDFNLMIASVARGIAIDLREAAVERGYPDLWSPTPKSVISCPQMETYGIQALFRFPTKQRSDLPGYVVAFNPSRPVKTWIDPDADLNAPAVHYRVFNPTAKAPEEVFQDLVLSGNHAATYNLPGAVVYQPYILVPSDATRGGGSINPIYLSLRSDAEALMSQLGGHSLGDEGVSTIFPVTYPPNEPRRLWYFMWRGLATNVGALLYNQNKRGIGSPGRWDLNGTEPTWIPEPTLPHVNPESLTVIPMPCRDLLPDERLVRGLFGWEIHRGEETSIGGGGVSPEQWAELYQLTLDTNAKITQLLTALRIGQ